MKCEQSMKHEDLLDFTTGESEENEVSPGKESTTEKWKEIKFTLNPKSASESSSSDACANLSNEVWEVQGGVKSSDSFSEISQAIEEQREAEEYAGKEL